MRDPRSSNRNLRSGASAAVFANAAPGKVNKYFGRLQVLSSAMMAFGHGSNDAQKVMGIITMALLSRGVIDTLEVPVWVILAAALAMGFGTFFGGWKVIKTLGVKMLKLQPVHGFAAETSATLIIVGASQLGMPVSTTHVISSSIIGVGATSRLSAVSVRNSLRRSSITKCLPAARPAGAHICPG